MRYGSKITRGFSRTFLFFSFLGKEMRDETATPWRISRRFVFFITFFFIYVYIISFINRYLHEAVPSRANELISNRIRFHVVPSNYI